MRFFCKTSFFCIIFFFLNFFCICSMFTQSVELSDTELVGEWQNSAKFVNFNFDKEEVIHELKTFYGLWRGKIHKTSFNELNVSPLVFENQLFMEYWILDNFENSDKNSKIKFYFPASNVFEISLDKPFVKNEIYGYLILDSLENVIKIMYWLCDLELSEEILQNQKAMITENTVELKSNQNFVTLENLEDEFFRNIKKYIKIGDKLYTCVEGRGTKIRNIEKIDLIKEFPKYQFIKKNESNFLVLDSPYLVQVETQH